MQIMDKTLLHYDGLRLGRRLAGGPRVLARTISHGSAIGLMRRNASLASRGKGIDATMRLPFREATPEGRLPSRRRSGSALGRFLRGPPCERQKRFGTAARFRPAWFEVPTHRKKSVPEARKPSLPKTETRAPACQASEHFLYASTRTVLCPPAYGAHWLQG